MVSDSINIPLHLYKIWVLFPYLETDDPNLKHYYDFSHSLHEYEKVFKELDADWTWQPVTMIDYKTVIDSIPEKSGGKTPLIMNLCDGDEINATPGVSVIHYLEEKNLIYTGANAYFYEVTTSKIPMKHAFDKAGVPNAAWKVIEGTNGSLNGTCNEIGTPILLKPAISGGSMGVSVKNVVNNDEELKARVNELNNGYRGWQLTTGGLLAEQFITGPEFTSFIIGSHTHPDLCIVYEPVERIFHESLPAHEKFLSFDRLWEIYEDETPMPGNGNFYNYSAVDISLAESLKQISLDAYCAVGGTGYARIDIRMDATTGRLYLLEVNAQCGLSEDEDYTSIGAILRFTGKTYTQLVAEVLQDALTRRGISN
jgi:D-alanine-D-alanine ligase